MWTTKQTRRTNIDIEKETDTMNAPLTEDGIPQQSAITKRSEIVLTGCTSPSVCSVHLGATRPVAERPACFAKSLHAWPHFCILPVAWQPQAVLHWIKWPSNKESQTRCHTPWPIVRSRGIQGPCISMCQPEICFAHRSTFDRQESKTRGNQIKNSGSFFLTECHNNTHVTDAQLTKAIHEKIVGFQIAMNEVVAGWEQ